MVDRTPILGVDMGAQGPTKDRNAPTRGTLVTFAPNGYLTIQQTADRLGMSTWDVLRLVREGQLTGVTLVDAGSLARYKEGEAS